MFFRLSLSLSLACQRKSRWLLPLEALFTTPGVPLPPAHFTYAALGCSRNFTDPRPDRKRILLPRVRVQAILPLNISRAWEPVSEHVNGTACPAMRARATRFTAR